VNHKFFIRTHFKVFKKLVTRPKKNCDDFVDCDTGDNHRWWRKKRVCGGGRGGREGLGEEGRNEIGRRSSITGSRGSAGAHRWRGRALSDDGDDSIFSATTIFAFACVKMPPCAHHAKEEKIVFTKVSPLSLSLTHTRTHSLSLSLFFSFSGSTVVAVFLEGGHSDYFLIYLLNLCLSVKRHALHFAGFRMGQKIKRKSWGFFCIFSSPVFFAESDTDRTFWRKFSFRSFRFN